MISYSKNTTWKQDSKKKYSKPTLKCNKTGYFLKRCFEVGGSMRELTSVEICTLLSISCKVKINHYEKLKDD